MAGLPFVLGLVAAPLLACGASDDRAAGPDGELTKQAGRRGEKSLAHRASSLGKSWATRARRNGPNVFYAGKGESEQIMPWTIDGVANARSRIGGHALSLDRWMRVRLLKRRDRPMRWEMTLQQRARDR
jgi:hypothetical protein